MEIPKLKFLNNYGGMTVLPELYLLALADFVDRATMVVAMCPGYSNAEKYQSGKRRMPILISRTVKSH